MEDKTTREFPIEENIAEFFTFPDESKLMIRKRSAGVGIYDQIHQTDQSLFISNDGRYVMFISMKGILFFDSLNIEWKVVNQFQGSIKFTYDTSFEYNDGKVEAVKVVLAMKLKASKFTEKLEFQYIIISLKEERPNIRLANLLHLLKIPLELIDSPSTQNSKPVVIKLLKEK